ncbi:MAG: hypothetical protein IH624_05370 [Phycisphaerae bacterium]|nr:hypothetical protein [Phycisphaerae bacterium]
MLRGIRKFIFGTAFLVLIVVLLVAAGIHFFGAQALKYSVEKTGSNTLQVPVTLDDVSFSIFKGRLGLAGLDIANPPGYQHEKMLQLASGQMDMDIRSLLHDTVVIHRMNLDNVILVIEQKDIVQNNLHEVLKSLPAGDAEPRPEDAGRKKLRIDTLTISNVRVRAKLLPIPGRLDTVELTLAPIEMTNLGHDNKLTLPILTAKILQAIAAGVAEKGQNILPRNMIEPMKTLLRGHGSMLLDVGQQILEKGAAAGKDLGKAATDLLKGLAPAKKEE